MFFVLVVVLFPLRLNIVCSVFCIFICRSFLISNSNLSSHPGFDFRSVIFRGTPIFSQTYFASAEIKLFKSVMLFVGIFVTRSFTFLVSDVVHERGQCGFLFRHDSFNNF